LKLFRFHAEKDNWSSEEIVRATTDKGERFPIIDFVAEAEKCPVCGSKLRISKSRCRLRPVMSFQAGPFFSREVLKQCVNDATHPIVHSEALARIVRPHQRYAYDIIVQVGLARYLRNMRREDIRAELLEQRSIDISTGSISNICDRFLHYLEALHLVRSPYLRAAMQKDGYPLHLDGTNDRGKGGVLVCMDGFRGWVLLAGKIPSEHEDHIRPLVEQTVALFGKPLATMRDLMRAGPNSVKSIKQCGIPDLVCHYHFLGAVGKKLFDIPHSNLRDMLKQHKVRCDAREFLRELRRYQKMGTAYEGRFGIGQVRDDLLALVHWALEGDGKKKLLFPFTLPHLEFYQRCRQAMKRAERWVPSPRSQPERRALRYFGTLISRIEKDKRLAEMAERLEKCWCAFCKLRDVLRLTDADFPRSGDTPNHQTEVAAVVHERLLEIQDKTESYLQQLRDHVGDHGKKKPVTPEGVILNYMEKYGDSLFGHPVVRDEQGAVIAVVERTNNISEHLFDQEKRNMRRRLGKAHLGRDLEDQPAQAFLVANLRDDDYVCILCGTLDNLANAFADLDQKALGEATPLARENRDTDLKRRVRALLKQDIEFAAASFHATKTPETEPIATVV
jgi:hypothetical protein